MSKTPINTLLKWLAVADMFVMMEYIPFTIYMYIFPGNTQSTRRYCHWHLPIIYSFVCLRVRWVNVKTIRFEGLANNLQEIIRCESLTRKHKITCCVPLRRTIWSWRQTLPIHLILYKLWMPFPHKVTIRKHIYIRMACSQRWIDLIEIKYCELLRYFVCVCFVNSVISDFPRKYLSWIVLANAYRTHTHTHNI